MQSNRRLEFYDSEKSFPKHIFVFRAGASESDFKKIAYWERQAFDTAFAEVSSEMMKPIGFSVPKKFALTIIVCQRNANYRLISSGGSGFMSAPPPEENCPPGTVLDATVMNPSLTEYNLVGHRASEGTTAKPMLCTVVVDTAEPRVSLSELENMTYILCFQHGNCFNSTAVPGVLYAAGELAKRGRSNWRTFTY
ncbi:hypothetical protein niasHS_016367 [Heterodera schachtii]|uniref:Piwi domain-containing protein n=1 Tax=Heterodera schachtii TaxID=97005 RepID=A0ABD2HV08_HETSC